MRVLFIYPRISSKKSIYKEYPIGIGLLATILKDKGIDVMIIDQQTENSSDDNVIQRAAEFDPEIIGFSLITSNYYYGVSLLQKMKNKLTNRNFIAGGLHISLFPKDAIKDGFDIAVIGAADAIIYDLINCTGTKKIVSIPNIVYQNRGIIKYNEITNNSIDISTIIDRSLYNMKLYTHHSINATIGCPYSCKFCYNYSSEMTGKKILVKSIDILMCEINQLVKYYGAEDIFFTDDVFLYNRRNIIDFCKNIIRSKIKVNLYIQLRADIISDDLILYLKESGCKRIYFGAESGSQSLLNSSNKKLRVTDIIKAIEVCKKYNMRVKTGWIYGLPFGGIKENLKTVDLILQTRPNEVSIHRLIPFPGTEYYNKRTKYGIMIKDKNTTWEAFKFDGIDSTIEYTYLPHEDLKELLFVTKSKLEDAGYMKPTAKMTKYTYTLPTISRHIDLLHGVNNE